MYHPPTPTCRFLASSLDRIFTQTYGHALTFQPKLGTNLGTCAPPVKRPKRLELQGRAQNSTESLHSIYEGIHHVGVLCKDITASLHFYQDILGMELNPDRPNDKLPYKGAWLWVGGEMIHLMELPNPDPLNGRPEHGGRDRHVCLSVKTIQPLEDMLNRNNIDYTKSKSGRAALFFRDPDQNVLEMAEQ